MCIYLIHTYHDQDQGTSTINTEQRKRIAHTMPPKLQTLVTQTNALPTPHIVHDAVIFWHTTIHHSLFSP